MLLGKNKAIWNEHQTFGSTIQIQQIWNSRNDELINSFTIYHYAVYSRLFVLNSYTCQSHPLTCNLYECHLWWKKNQFFLVLHLTNTIDLKWQTNKSKWFCWTQQSLRAQILDLVLQNKMSHWWRIYRSDRAQKTWLIVIIFLVTQIFPTTFFLTNDNQIPNAFQCPIMLKSSLGKKEENYNITFSS